MSNYRSSYLDAPLRGRIVAPKPPMQPWERALGARSDGMNRQYGLGAYAPATNGNGGDGGGGGGGERPAPYTPTMDDPRILSDPALLRAKKLADTRRGDARASALNRKKQLAIQTGDERLAREFGLDEDSIRAARENPLSVFALLKEAGRREERDVNETRNKENLWYSGTRANDLSELAKSLLAREARAGSDARAGFSQIENDLLDDLFGADTYQQSEEAAAYQRALDAYANGAQPSPVSAPQTASRVGPAPAQAILGGAQELPLALLAELVGSGRRNATGPRSYAI